MDKYHFIVYEYGSNFKNLHNDVIKGCPIEWQIVANSRRPEQYTLVNWKEITEEQYEKYNEVK